MPYPLTPVRWFHSDMADAPVLRGEAGALIQLLDACLINGFCTRTLNSLVVSGGVATATISAGNPYERHAVIRISGASIAALNGDHRIDTAGASTFTFPAPGVPDGAASGTMTVIRSPAGWSKPFAGTNKAAYQGDENSTQLYLRVDDTEALYSNVRGYENLTDIDTGTGLFPTVAQQANCWWSKSTVSDASARSWALIADGSMVWFMSAFNSSYPLLALPNHYGDLVPFSNADVYHCTLGAFLGNKTNSLVPPASYHPATYVNNTNHVRYVARLFGGAGSAAFGLCAQSVFTSTFTLYGSSDPATDVGGGAMIGPPILAFNGGAANATPLRGVLPGIRPALQKNPFPIVSGCVGEPIEQGGTVFFPVSVIGVLGNMANSGQVVFDLVGPWR